MPNALKRLTRPHAWAGFWLAFFLLASPFFGQFHALEHGLGLSQLRSEGAPGVHLAAHPAHAAQASANAAPWFFSKHFDDHAAGSQDCKIWDSLLCSSGLNNATAAHHAIELAPHLPIPTEASPRVTAPLAQLARGPPTFL